jgi:hypothetical protein
VFNGFGLGWVPTCPSLLAFSSSFFLGIFSFRSKVKVTISMFFSAAPLFSSLNHVSPLQLILSTENT